MICKGELAIISIIKAIDKWSRENEVEINKRKSGIMIIRQDRRTKEEKQKEIQGYPIVTHYKYLGVELDDCLNLSVERENKKNGTRT